MILLFQVLRKFAGLKIGDHAIFKIAELVAYAIGINLFLLGAEVFKEFYSGSIHMAPIQYLYFGLHGNTGLVPWMWTAMLFNGTAFVLFLIPKLRHNHLTLNIGACLIIVGVYIEKGMGLVVPGFIPGSLGEIYQYKPTLSEMVITAGIWAVGALLFTFMAKLAITVNSEDDVKSELALETV